MRHLPDRAQRGRRTRARGGAIAAVLCLGLSACGASPAQDVSAREGALAEQAKGLAAKDLKDPDTAVFRRGLLQRSPKAVGAAWKTTVVCGEMNARNSYGAYTGFRRFIVEPGAGAKRLEPVRFDDVPLGPDGPQAPEDRSFEADWAAACQGAAPPHRLEPF